MEAGTQFIGIKPEINMAERKSNVANNPTDVFTIEDIAEAVIPAPIYAVYTALLTQSGEGNPYTVTEINGDLSIGVTYKIEDQGGSGWDFTNVGAPNNNLETYFVATGTTPNSWGIDGALRANSADPVVTVLENTIGNIWFTYIEPGFYRINIPQFDMLKTYYSRGGMGNATQVNLSSQIEILSNSDSESLQVNTLSDNILNNTPIEIRIYE